jgi:diacylglycerol kinase (ATP)
VSAPTPIREVALLTNPAAGHGNALKATVRARAHLVDRGVRVRELIGRDATESSDLARVAVAEGTDALVVVGGDGMVHVALPAVVGTDTPLGVVPAGTGNDTARAHGWPRNAPEQAVDALLDGHRKRIDIGLVRTADGTSSYFGSVLAVGFDSLVSDRTNRMRWPHGRARYNLAIIAELANMRPLPFVVTLADGTRIEQDVLLVAVGNTSSYGGGMLICPDADPTDALLDLTVIDAVPRRRAIAQFPKLFNGSHVDSPTVATFRTTSLRIESPGINAYADGEHLGPLPADVELLPGAVSVLVPR